MFPKRGPVKAGYRIKQTAGKKLEPIQPSKSMPVNKLKPHLRYSGEQQPVQQKTVLLNTIIEEHLLKFGLIESFDTFIKEVAEKSMVSLSDITKVESLKEIQDKVLDVGLHDIEFQKRKRQGLFCVLAKTGLSEEAG